MKYLILLLLCCAWGLDLLAGPLVQEPSDLSARITMYSKKYNLDRARLSCLYSIESGYNVKAISATKDHGIGQINASTAKGFNMDISKLTSDINYSMDRSAFMLSHYKKLKQSKEPTLWACRYNVGPGNLSVPARLLKCRAYLTKLNSCIRESYSWGIWGLLGASVQKAPFKAS